jgi:hypothetical protein
MRFAIPVRPRLVDTLRTYTRQDFTADLTAGVTVGIVALPLAMAFAIASGVTPQASRPPIRFSRSVRNWPRPGRSWRRPLNMSTKS